MKKACMRLGDAVWTMTYIINKDETLSILNFDSQDNDGYMFEDTLDKLQSISELEGRVADTVTIDGKTYDVKNKAGIFTYKQPL